MTGTVAAGAVENPVPKFETSTPEIEPIPEDDQPRKVALAPNAGAEVRVAFAPLVEPVIICPNANAPVDFAIVIFPRTKVVIIAVAAGVALLEIVSPATNVPEVVRAFEL